MIHDHINNSTKYEALHPRFGKAFAFLKTADLQNLPLGKIEIDGDNIFVSTAVVEGVSPEQSKMEIHRRYIDIQMPISKKETIGWISAENLKDIALPYDKEKDVALYNEKATNFVTIKPKEFVVFFPEDGHQPCIGTGEIKKIVMKVAY